MNPGNIERARVKVKGVVQGVGFRPFVYQLANQHRLNGWVCNSAQGVLLEVEGSRHALDRFLDRLRNEKPLLATIQEIDPAFLEPAGYQDFNIRLSDPSGEKNTIILPDIATCSDCLREILNPQDRRYRYPFINCIHCGPRFTLITDLPYDRSNTSMNRFPMCDACASEYSSPENRRFHAQPIACPECGPHLELWNREGAGLARRHQALLESADRIRSGQILAVKGIGGFQLIVDAQNAGAVRALRQRKHREEKPFALMYPSLESIGVDCRVSPLEAALLASPESPIVLLKRHSGSARLAPGVAPGNPDLGTMLPYSPLHHLLLAELNFPVVATSGNRSDEPICIDEREALERLRDIADVFLVHDRPIVRHVDDSVARVVLGREQLLRRARGYAPRPVHQRQPVAPILAVGAHLKNTVALGFGHEIFVSQHIGDLETEQAYSAFTQVARDLPRLYDARPAAIACDLHPDYLSTAYAESGEAPIIRVQHHHAHVLACMAEHQLKGPVLGVSWDGTGYGTDGTIWGGEFLLVDAASFQRVAHLRTFRLPGGDACIKAPCRTAIGLLHEMRDPLPPANSQFPPLQEFSNSELGLIRKMLDKGIHAPATSSVGRLFDAVASLLGVRQRVSYEGQAAMELEYAIEQNTDDSYPMECRNILDWKPMIQAMLEEHQPPGVKAAKFHNTLAETVVRVAKQIGVTEVVLTGGCFQNRYLLERTAQRLRQAKFEPYWPQCIPPNDGGIALGQVLAAAQTFRKHSQDQAEPVHENTTPTPPSTWPPRTSRVGGKEP